MTSNEENDAYQNDRTRLLSKNSDEPTRKLHCEMGRFTYPRSDSEGNHEDIQLCEKGEPLPVNSEINEGLPSAEVSKSWFFSAIPKRYIIIILVALANFNMYCIRMCVNVTIVAMTHSEGKQNGSKGSHLATEDMVYAPDSIQIIVPTEYDDNCSQISRAKCLFYCTILASLYWSYTAMQIPAGLLCVRYGGCFLLGIAIFGSSVLTLATPFIVRQNVYAFIFLRIMEGGLLGLVAASGISLLSKWAPVYERSIFLMVIMSGLLWGTVFANSLSGILAGSSWGWPSVFYYFGVQGIVWYLCWLYFAYEEPSDHPNISEAELNHIGKHWNTKLSLRDIPWRYIVTSIRVWAIIVPNFTDCWSFYTFMMSFPTYLKDVQDLDITTIGLASSLPYVMAAIFSLAWGYFIDVLRRRKYISTTNSRKLSSFVGSGVGAIFVVAMVYATSTTSAVAIITIGITFANFTSSGPGTNVVELAPKYAGVLMGITNFVCNITGFISPEVVGVLTAHGDIRHQWAIVFYFTAGVNVLGMAFYICFASSEKQAWADQ